MISLLNLFSPFAIGFLVAFILFAVISRTGRFSPDFSSIAAAIISAPILVFLAAALTMVFGGLTSEDAPTTAFVLAFVAFLFAPTVLLLVPLLTFYLIRALQRKRLLSGLLVSGIGVCCIAAQMAWVGRWLYVLADLFD
jgi:hypothetical protein